MKKLLVFLLTLSFLSAADHPFDYDLHMYTIPGDPGAKTMICFHGAGANYTIIDTIKEQTGIEETLVSFNFPDYDMEERGITFDQSAFGTIDDLLPALYVLKHFVIDEHLDAIDLYGFSNGGGIAINVFTALNSSRFDKDLHKIGIFKEEKSAILHAIQDGTILLDCPIKSIEEVMNFIALPGINFIAKNYQKNRLRPIDSLRYLHDLGLQIILYFENPDELLSNRDDNLFIKRLKRHNSKGTTLITSGSNGGHIEFHPELWSAFASLTQ